jgi:hypothetical protein
VGCPVIRVRPFTFGTDPSRAALLSMYAPKIDTDPVISLAWMAPDKSFVVGFFGVRTRGRLMSTRPP